MRNLGDLYMIETLDGQAPDCNNHTMGLAFLAAMASEGNCTVGFVYQQLSQ
jgi:hypothetical protein